MQYVQGNVSIWPNSIISDTRQTLGSTTHKQSVPCRDVHDAQTTVYMEARGCPFLHHVSAQQPGCLVRNMAQTIGSKPLCRGVHDPVCDAATAGDPGPTYQSAYELLSIGAIDSALISISFYSWMFLVADGAQRTVGSTLPCPGCHD